MKSIHYESLTTLRLPARVQRQRLQRVIMNELTERQRTTLIAYYFQDMNIPQIAAQQGVNKSTVCRTLHRAERRLQLLLKY